ncbi:hypothetical protein [Aurantivibrio plasticivorans]
MWKAMTMVGAVLTLSACQTPPQTQELMNQNQALQNQLAEANTRIAELETDSRVKQADLDELNRVLGVLDTEKSSRTQESSQLRGQVRKFVQQQIDALKVFLVQGDLLDYVGGELVERSTVQDESLMLVDLAHPVPRGGALTGVSGYFSTAVPFQVKIFRPVNDDLVVIWESKLINVTNPGLNRYDFPVTVGLEKGDVLGYFFPQAVGISFDEGTSDTRYLSKNLGLGESVRVKSLNGEARKRSYSIGVYGLLN